MESFIVGEIIWAKIRGYPWWPALITGIIDENKEKKYVVGFIGDNTHATLPKQKLAKFMKEYKNFSKTKKKLLLESIRIAKEMLDSKGKGEEEKEKLKKNINTEKSDSNKEKKNKLKFKQEDQKKEDHIEDNIDNIVKVKKKLRRSVGLHKDNTASDKILNSKRRRHDNGNELNELMKKIINYLLYICKNVENTDVEKECLLKVLEYLKDYKIDNPIQFLKRTSLGIMIKYLNNKLSHIKEITDSTNEVYTNFEGQVMAQLFEKN